MKGLYICWCILVYHKRHQTTPFLLSQDPFTRLSCQLYVPCLPFIVMMALTSGQITWNWLYAAKPCERHFAEEQICSHFVRKRLASRGVEKADVRYNLHSPLRLQYRQVFADPWAGMGRVAPQGLAAISWWIFTGWITKTTSNTLQHITSIARTMLIHGGGWVGIRVLYLFVIICWCQTH